MVQEFQVLRCFSCQVFQVHQVKKSKKWSCKLCGEKQSLLKVYGQGSGADCRHHVQKLNLLQGQVEQAATGTDNESCQNDDDLDEGKKSLAASQEAASMSRWNKYLEEEQDGDHEDEEEEGIVSTDHELCYSLQDCTSRTLSFRKRKHLPYHGADFYKEETKENISKKNKIYEVGNPPETSQVYYRKTEDVGCIKLPDKPVSHPLPLQTCSGALSPRTRSEGFFKQSTCSTASFLKREPKMGTIFNNFDHYKKTGTDCSITINQDVLRNDEPITTNTLSVRNISSPGLNKSGVGSADQQSDLTIKSSSLASLQKPIIQAHLFQTDEDFDDNY